MCDNSLNEFHFLFCILKAPGARRSQDLQIRAGSGFAIGVPKNRFPIVNPKRFVMDRLLICDLFALCKKAEILERGPLARLRARGLRSFSCLIFSSGKAESETNQ
jgi:hypothetical protein